jgi:hypothetical protein
MSKEESSFGMKNVISMFAPRDKNTKQIVVFIKEMDKNNNVLTYLKMMDPEYIKNAMAAFKLETWYSFFKLLKDLSPHCPMLHIRYKELDDVMTETNTMRAMDFLTALNVSDLAKSMSNKVMTTAFGMSSGKVGNNSNNNNNNSNNTATHKSNAEIEAQMTPEEQARLQQDRKETEDQDEAAKMFKILAVLQPLDDSLQNPEIQKILKDKETMSLLFTDSKYSEQVEWLSKDNFKKGVGEWQNAAGKTITAEQAPKNAKQMYNEMVKLEDTKAVLYAQKFPGKIYTNKIPTIWSYLKNLSLISTLDLNDIISNSFVTDLQQVLIRIYSDFLNGKIKKISLIPRVFGSWFLKSIEQCEKIQTENGQVPDALVKITKLCFFIVETNRIHFKRIINMLDTKKMDPDTKELLTSVLSYFNKRIDFDKLDLKAILNHKIDGLQDDPSNLSIVSQRYQDTKQKIQQYVENKKPTEKKISLPQQERAMLELIDDGHIDSTARYRSHPPSSQIRKRHVRKS